jgi:[ribosomal protein S5]-alanine N-acetyltransferase
MTNRHICGIVGAMGRPARKPFPLAIETRRVKLSRWQPCDAVAFRPIAQDPLVMRYIHNGKPWSDSRVREFIPGQMRHAARDGFCFWKIQRKPDGRLIGLCGLQALPLGCRWEVEIGWWLAPPYWGRGLATEAAGAVMNAAFKNLSVERIVAIAVPENYASRRIMQKIGMRYERMARHKGFRVVLYAARG